MEPIAIVSAAARGLGADFLVGLLVGGCLGFLLGPVLRSWLTYREWADASRQERLVDQLVARMERDVEGGGEIPPADPEGRSASRGSWRTSH